MECSICHDTKELNDLCSVGCCKQQFHWTCLNGWLNESDSCPTCRAKIERQSQELETDFDINDYLPDVHFVPLRLTGQNVSGIMINESFEPNSETWSTQQIIHMNEPVVPDQNI